MRGSIGRRGGDMPPFSPWRWNDVVHIWVARGIFAGLDHVNGSLRNINAPNFETSVMKSNGRGETNIPQANDANRQVAFFCRLGKGWGVSHGDTAEPQVLELNAG